MTLLKDNNYKEINVALLSLEADIKKLSNNGSFDSSAIDRQLAEINSRIDKINAGGNNTSAAINDIRYEIEDINSKLKGNSSKIENIEQKLADIFSAENKVTDFNTTTDSGIYYWFDDAANRPTGYGVLLVNKYNSGSNSIWINQIAYGTNGKIYFRQNINSGNWTEWKAVAFDGEITAKKVANALTVNGKTYDGSEAVDAGVQKIENGGTGATTAKDAFMNLANGLSEDNGPLDTEYVIYKNTAGTHWGLYTLSHFWEYIKGKISSVLGLTESKLTLQGGTESSNSYTDANPKLEFKNIDGSQNISLTFTDWDAVQEPASLTLNGNQGNEYFIAPNIKATGNFYGNLSGKADTAGSAATADSLSYQHTNEINFKGGAQASCYFNYRNADTGNPSPVGTMSYIFCNYSNDTSKSVILAGTVKAPSKLVIPIGAPSSLEDGCIWIS